MNLKVIVGALIAIIVAAGCGDAPSCESAVRSAMKRFSPDQPNDEMIATMTGVCIEQKWSAKARSCLAEARTEELAGKCLERRDDSGGGRRSEAEINLNAINKAADAEYAETAQYPVGTVGLTPSTSCCEQAGKKCQVVASDWNGVPVWDALGFEMTQPSFFQYSYTSDGKTFSAAAVGDLDCDGQTVTYSLEGAAPNGSPTSTLTKPRRAD